jgi:hypothetical protein
LLITCNFAELIFPVIKGFPLQFRQQNSLAKIPAEPCFRKPFYRATALLTSQRSAAIWLFSSGTANSVYRFIRYQQNRKPTSSAVPDKSLLSFDGAIQHNASGRFSEPFYCLLSALMR